MKELGHLMIFVYIDLGMFRYKGYEHLDQHGTLPFEA